MSCPTQTFKVTAAQFEELKAKAGKSGLMLMGVGGVTVQHGATIEWNYDEATETLSVACTSKPLYISCDMIDGALKELIEG